MLCLDPCRVRLFVGNAGPNLVSSFHIIGCIFDKVGAVRVLRWLMTALMRMHAYLPET